MLKKTRLLALALSTIGFVAMAFLLSHCGSGEVEDGGKSKDETLAYSADVSYVGSANCKSCHADVFATFGHTGKGRAFLQPERATAIEDFSPFTVYDSFSDLSYTSFWLGEDLFQLEYRIKNGDTVHRLEYRVDQMMGSGNQARSYIIEENGYYYEMPLTWYTEKGIWALSPGYENGGNSRFDRPIAETCMHCHNSDYSFVPQSLNRYAKVGQGIGCEKCHGPGEAHVKLMENGGSTDALGLGIVNPSNLPVQLGFDVCRQCHLEGVTVNKKGKELSDFRPGRPLNEYVDVFLPVSEDASDYGFASHAERLQLSACYKGSMGKLTCTTCHDPHRSLPEDKVLFYKEKCLSCHQLDDCGEDHAVMATNQNDCAGCHMPRSGTTDIPHVSTSDHFIRVRNGEEGKLEPTGDNLLTFKNFTSDTSDKATLLMANLEYYEKVDHDPRYLERVRQYVGHLDQEQAVRYAYLSNHLDGLDLTSLHPGFSDDAYIVYFAAELLRRNSIPSLEFFEKAHQLAPVNIELFFKLGEAYAQMGQLAQAKVAFEEVVSLKPLHAPALASLGYLNLTSGFTDIAEKQLLLAVRADPNLLLAKENLLNVMMAKQDWRAAKNLLKELMKADPTHPGYLRVQELIKDRGV